MEIENDNILIYTLFGSQMIKTIYLKLLMFHIDITLILSLYNIV